MTGESPLSPVTGLLLWVVAAAAVAAPLSGSVAAAGFGECFQEKLLYPTARTTQAPKTAGEQLAAILLTRESNSSAFEAAFYSSINNKRYRVPDPWPTAIVLPVDASHVQATILCAREHGLVLRVRSGGHDFGGLSYRSVRGGAAFVILDVGHGFRSLRIDNATGTAWAGAGVTLGELYYQVARESGGRLGFPGGVYPTVGLGGHVSGGGVGYMIRSHGIAADQVLDARVVDAAGRLLDRSAMGEDLFWAIRGGGAASFCVILEYKLRLVPVSPLVTVFNVNRTATGHNVSTLFSKWQHVAPKAPRELYIAVFIDPGRTAGSIETSFRCAYQGTKQALLRTMATEFPELGITDKDCLEMSWFDSLLFQAGFSGRPATAFLDRAPSFFNLCVTLKYDFFEVPIPDSQLDGIRDWIGRTTGPGNGNSNNTPIESYQIQFDPLGGAMDEISSNSTPFPHRKGSLYKALYMVIWATDGEAAAERHEGWLRQLHQYMTPFASQHPRRSYLNGRDLDLGMNRDVGVASYQEAKKWGDAYFAENFRRLALIKSHVDPHNFFWSEQSVPLLDIVTSSAKSEHFLFQYFLLYLSVVGGLFDLT